MIRWRRSTKLLATLWLLGAGCSERRSPQESKGDSVVAPTASAAGSAEPSPAGSAHVDALGEQKREELLEGDRSYPVRVWRFPLDRYSVRIVDVGMKTSLTDALESTGARFAVNGGFFGVDDKPMGLAISDRTTLSSFSKKLSGGVLAIEANLGRLYDVESYVPSASPSFAIQCRPRLVVDGVVNVKSDDGHRAERTALCLRDAGKTLDVVLVHGSDVKAPTGAFLFPRITHATDFWA